MQAPGPDDDPSSSSNDWWPPDEEDDDWGTFPPPPPPPSTGPACSGDLYCHIGAEGGPMGAHFDRASFPSLPIVAVCSSVVLVAVLVASFLFWRHKSKVQNLLPSKTEQHQGHLEGMSAANGVTYEDILAGHHTTRLTQGHLAGSQTLMPLEILDVKLGDMGPPHIMAMHHAPCYPPSRETGCVMSGKPFHHPVYEEVSQAPTSNVSRSPADKMAGRSLTSDEDLADEEIGSGQCSATSSVRGSTGGDLCRDPVSSDGEDCVEPPYPVNTTFGYNPKQGRQQAYPEQRTRRGSAEPFSRSPHSNKPNGGGPPPRPSHIPSSTFGPRPVDPRQWMTSQCYDQDNPQVSAGYPPVSVGYPQVSASQENIYSTIDEDEVYPVANPLTSLAQRGSPMGKGSAHGLTRPPLSQRKPDENGGSSYGDILPAFHSASFM